jgi:hypothetical protein
MSTAKIYSVQSWTRTRSRPWSGKRQWPGRQQPALRPKPVIIDGSHPTLGAAGTTGNVMPPPSGISYVQGLQNKPLASRSGCCKLASDNEIGHGNQINSIIKDDSIGQQSTPNANLAVKAKRLNNKRRQRRRKQRTDMQVVSIGEAERASPETGPVCDDLTMAKDGRWIEYSI